MSTFNTDDMFNNDDLTTGGHDTHHIDTPTSDDSQLVGVHTDDTSSHNITTTTTTLGVSPANVLTESSDLPMLGHNVVSDVTTTDFESQLNNIMNPHGHNTIAINHDVGYNETLAEIQNQSTISDHESHNIGIQKTEKSSLSFGCTGCATKCLHTCHGGCQYSCSGSCDSSSHK